MNVQRLKELAKLLHSIKVTDEVDFDMGGWVTKTLFCGGLKVKQGKVEIEEGFCKTSACILGHAAMHKPFITQGLKAVFKPSYASDEVVSGEVQYRGKKAFEAGAAFFGLDQYDAEGLFNGGFRTPKQGAIAVERLIKKLEKEAKEAVDA